MNKIKVLVVDDSLLVQQMLCKMLSDDPNIEVVGLASDPYVAREMIKQQKPDVLTLDIEMPKMDGISFLRNLMRLHPIPVVMISTLTERGADVSFQAVEMGAVDFVTKPKVDLENSFENYAQEIRRKVKVAAKVSRLTLERQYARYAANMAKKPKVEALPPRVEKFSTDAVLPKATRVSASGSQKIIAIGSSTGGTEAIKEILIRMPENCPAIVISQHIPASFSAPFAQRMDTLSAMRVVEASDGDEIVEGSVYIAPGSKHLIIEARAGKYFCRLNDGAPVNRHKPSVDVMFRSVVQAVGKNAIGVILTGMGADGAVGLQEIQEVGGPTIAQDEKTSVVWGMPGEAVKIGAADYILPLEDIAHKILELAAH